MGSRSSVPYELSHPKRTGSHVAANQFEAIDALEPVGDDVAEWHDARTTGIIDGTDPVYLGGICLVERGVEVEIKSTSVVVSNGGSDERSGRFYFRKGQHERLVDAGAAYLLVVYAPEKETPTLARLLVPAVVVDDIIDGRWTKMGDEYDGRCRKTLAWTTFLNEDKIIEDTHGN